MAVKRRLPHPRRRFPLRQRLMAYRINHRFATVVPTSGGLPSGALGIISLCLPTLSPSPAGEASADCLMDKGRRLPGNIRARHAP